MKMIIISSFKDIPHEAYLLNLLFYEGLEYYHIRKKCYTIKQMEQYLDKIPSCFHDRIIIHSHFQLVERYGLKGAHFTKNFTEEMYFKELSTLPNSLGQLSCSIHTLTELKKIPIQYNYVFLSPIFDSISNIGYNSKFRINDLKLFLSQRTERRPEVIALSGINYEKVDKIFEIGFDGMALLGHIWGYFEETEDLIGTVKRFKDIQNKVKNLEINSPNTVVQHDIKQKQ